MIPELIEMFYENDLISKFKRKNFPHRKRITTRSLKFSVKIKTK